MTVLSALVVAGLVGVGIGWRGLAASVFVPIQLPYAVSGAMGGLGLSGFALGILAIQASRRAEARRRADMDRVLAAAIDALYAARQRR